MKNKLKKVLVSVIMLGLVIVGVQSIRRGIQESKTYYERNEKYITVEAEVNHVHKFGLGYTVDVWYKHKGSTLSACIEKPIGIAPQEGETIEIEVDSVYPIRVRPTSNGVFKMVMGALLIVFMGCLQYVLMKHYKGKLSLQVSPKAKRVGKIVVAVMLIWIVANGVDVIISSIVDSRDSNWGLKMSVSDVSPEKITVHLERDDPEHSDRLLYGSDFMLEKRTLIGWKTLYPPHGYIFTLEAYELENVDANSIEMFLENRFGKLPTGIYRIRKDLSVDDLYTYPEDEREGLEQEVYATFVVLW